MMSYLCLGGHCSLEGGLFKGAQCVEQQLILLAAVMAQPKMRLDQRQSFTRMLASQFELHKPIKVFKALAASQFVVMRFDQALYEASELFDIQFHER